MTVTRLFQFSALSLGLTLWGCAPKDGDDGDDEGADDHADDHHTEESSGGETGGGSDTNASVTDDTGGGEGEGDTSTEGAMEGESTGGASTEGGTTGEGTEGGTTGEGTEGGTTGDELGLCGDGIINGMNETCDDRNNAAGDGCGSQCTIEADKSCTGEPSVCGKIAYVGGSGDPYQCDGTADELDINRALTFVHETAGYVGARLRSTALCTIGGTIKIFSNTVLEGDRGAIVRLKPNAGWPSGQPIITQAEPSPRNITLRGFEIDGNRSNQAESSGYSYYNAIAFREITGLTVHDMIIHSSLNDGINVNPGHRLHFFRNRCYNIGHDCYYILEGSSDIRIHDDSRLSTESNSGVRLVRTTNARVYRETIYGIAHACVQIQGSGSVEVRDMTCYDAVNGVVAFAYGNNPKDTVTIHLHHNLIYNSRGGASAKGIRTAGYHATIENNVIWNVGGAAISDEVGYSSLPSGSGYQVVVRSNIIGRAQYGLSKINTREQFTVQNNCFFENSGGNYSGVPTGTGDTIGDPLFVGPTDFHLKSAAGRFLSGQWVTDPMTSPCIDAGHPSSPFSLEPPPNGGRINAGRYGNTSEASKTP